MGLRDFLKKILGKTETAIDVAGDKFDDVSATVKKTGTLIADDASDFAKKTFSNLKDALKDEKTDLERKTDELKKDAENKLDDVKSDITKEEN